MAAKWTFMVYMAGFNNLSPFAAADLDELRMVGSTDDVKIAVFSKRLGTAAQQLVVGKDGRDEQPEALGNVDSGDPQTLLNFIRWATTTAPAERYALVVWNHGSGWQPDDLEQLYAEVRMASGDSGVTHRELGVRASQSIGRGLFSTSLKRVLALPTAGERAIASDDGTGHSMDTVELGRVLAKAHEELNAPLALLGMDACLMSTAEVAYEVKDHVDAIVGSEELEPGDGWPYTLIMQDLVAKPDMAGAALGAVVVDRYIESYERRQPEWPVTQCAVATSHISEFAEGLDGLAEALVRHLQQTGSIEHVLQAQGRAVGFMGELIDLGTFCRGLQAGGADQSLKDAAGRMVDVLTPGGYVVAEEHRGPTVEGCLGVTVYFPKPLAPVSQYYADLLFADQGWDDFLHGYQRALRGDFTAPRPDARRSI